MYTGLTGKVMIGEDPIAYVSNWSIEDTTDIIEFAQLGGGVTENRGYKLKVAGQQSWSASAEGAVDFATASGQSALFTAKHAGTIVDCEFYLNENVKFAGKGIIESLSVDLSAEDKGNISISISGSGKLTSPAADDPKANQASV